jgi:hypothetical protein
MENVMPHLSNALLLVSCIGLSLSIFLAVRAFFENRREEAAPFGRSIKSSLVQSKSSLAQGKSSLAQGKSSLAQGPRPQGSSSDDQDLREGRSRFGAVDGRDPSAAQYSDGSGALQQSRGQD